LASPTGAARRRAPAGGEVSAAANPFPVPPGLRSEEDVKIKFLVPFLAHNGYKSDWIDFNKPIEVHEGRKQKTIFADAVVYTSAAKTAPLIVCETKPPTEPLTNSDKEQAISYARLMDRIAPLVLLTNGLQSRVFQSLSKNRISELPKRKDLRDDFVKFVVSAEVQASLRTEAKHELFIIDDVQSFKTILRACHDEIRNNDGYDATRAFDELSKVLFCKMHEEREHPEDGNRFRTVVFDDTLSRLGVNVVKQIWDETKNDKRFAGLFDLESVISLQDRTIRKIVSQFENYDLSLTAFDVKGEAFEFFLGETFTGGLGQYFTPRNVVEFMIDAVDPKIGQKIVDPFCGTGGFLIFAFEVVSAKIRLQEFSDDEKSRWKVELSNRSLYGTDWAERTTLACKMNMIVHGDGSAGILLHHGLTDVPGKIEEGEFDLCVTNPPFGSSENDPVVLAKYELGRGRKSQDRVILAVERALRLVKPGGIVATIVIDGMLNNDSKAYSRNYVRQNAFVRGIISLPSVTFEGYHARAKTSILFLEKKAAPDETGGQQQTFMAIVENSGYAPNGAPVAGNELPEVLLDFSLLREICG
jgi:type I restriction enzyme M protein